MRFAISDTASAWSRRHLLGFAVATMVWSTCLVSALKVSAGDFLSAIRAGNLDKVTLLAKDQPKLVRRSVDGNPPLYWAVVDHHVEVAKWLLENGADVNQQCGQDRPTPIFEARTAEMAKLLLDHGADLKVTGKWSATPLSEAVRGDHVGVVKLLLAAGETLTFEEAVELGETKLVAEMLAEKPWLAKPPRKPLYHAAEDGNLELVELLLQYGADPDLDFGFSNIRGPFTPVSNAVTSGHYEVAELLLKRGASPNVSGGRNHDNLFLFAIAYLDAKFTKLMLEHGADLIVNDYRGHNFTPLHVASALGGADGIWRVDRVGQPESLKGSRAQVLEKVHYLLQAGAAVNARTADGSTPLSCAAIAGHKQVCELLLNHGAELDVASACLLGRQDFVERCLEESPEVSSASDLPMRQPALHWAARCGNIEIVKLLLCHGAAVDARAPELEYEDASGFSVVTYRESPGPTALLIAAGLGHDQVVQVLLDHGADINLKAGDDSYARSALEMACSHGHLDTIRLLLDRGAKVDLDNLAYLLPDISDTGLLARLFDAANFDFKGPDAAKLLAQVVNSNGTQAADLLIARGAQPDIFSACRLGRVDDVRRLIEATPALAIATQPDRLQVTPIALAVQNGHAEVVRLLISKGVPLSTLDTQGTSLAHQAAERGHLEVMQLLVVSGLSLDARDDEGATLLHSAASGSQPAIARYLISHGANVNARDFNCATPLHVLGGWGARSMGDDEKADEEIQRTIATAKTLLDAGAEVNVKDKLDWTPLHHAAYLRLECVAELLLARGADVNARNFRNETPLAQAEDWFWQRWFDRPHQPVAKLLREHGGVK